MREREGVQQGVESEGVPRTLSNRGATVLVTLKEAPSAMLSAEYTTSSDRNRAPLVDDEPFRA